MPATGVPARGRGSALLFGALFLIAGLAVVLSALNVIPTADEKFGAPRWIVAAIGLAFTGAGLYVVTAPWASQAQQTAIGSGIALTFVSAMACFLTWVTVAGADGRLTVGIGPVAIALPPGAAALLERLVSGALALVFDTITVVAWWSTLRHGWRALVHRRAGAP